MFGTVHAKLTRRLALWCVAPLPVERRRRIDRWLRGRDQFRKLAHADLVVVSHGKSGRTWLRVMLSGFYARLYGLRGNPLLGFDNLHRADARIPKVFFTHDNYLKDYTGNRTSKRDFYGKKVILLVRQPQDVTVSEYFNWKHRMKPGKMYLNDFPPHGEDVSIFEFAMRPCGIDRVVGFMNLWAQELSNLDHVLMVRYEDMRQDPAREFARIVQFAVAPEGLEGIDAGAVEDAVAWAVEHASLENMRRMEQHESRWWGGGRLKPGDPDNPQSYKVRRARVGGYRDYFEPEQVAAIDAKIETELSPHFGYRLAGTPRPGPGVGPPAAAPRNTATR